MESGHLNPQFRFSRLLLGCPSLENAGGTLAPEILHLHCELCQVNKHCQSPQTPVAPTEHLELREHGLISIKGFSLVLVLAAKVGRVTAEKWRSWGFFCLPSLVHLCLRAHRN